MEDNAVYEPAETDSEEDAGRAWTRYGLFGLLGALQIAPACCARHADAVPARRGDEPAYRQNNSSSGRDGNVP